VENSNLNQGHEQVPCYSYFIFCKTKLETMGTIRHGLCRRLWQSSTHSSAMILLATSWAMLGAPGFVKFELGGGAVNLFPTQQK
jgi:hypothetical protein